MESGLWCKPLNLLLYGSYSSVALLFPSWLISCSSCKLLGPFSLLLPRFGLCLPPGRHAVSSPPPTFVFFTVPSAVFLSPSCVDVLETCPLEASAWTLGCSAVRLTDGVERAPMASPRRSATCPPLFSMNHFSSDRQWAVRIRARRSVTRLTTSAACYHGDAECPVSLGCLSLEKAQKQQ